MSEHNIQMIITDNGDDFVLTAARILWDSFEKNPGALITLPTGNTPLGVYRTLIHDYAAHQDIWSKIRYVALDEYAGLAPDDERLFANWLGRVFLDPVGITPENRFLFNSLASEQALEAARMENLIMENGLLDLAVLGLGGNGHLAFNEPGSTFESLTRLIEIAPETRQANAAYWGDIEKVPTHGYTLGLKTITQARQIILLVNGAGKAAILDKVLNGPITPDVPATILRTVPGVTIITDKAAAGENQ